MRSGNQETRKGGCCSVVREKSDKKLALWHSLIRSLVGYEGSFEFDESKLDGMTRKLLDVSRVERLGWKPRVSLKERH